MSPELRHLRAFLAVCEEGTFTAGAERLFLTQQQLSRQVAQMEDELGVRLFARTTRRVELTDAGERMLDDARRAVRAADAAFATARGDVAPLRVDVSSSGLETGAMILERLRRTCPDLGVRQVERGVAWGLGALRRGELDVLLGHAGSAPDEVASRLVRREPLLIGMAATHPLADAATVPITALRDVPLLLPADEAAGEWTAFIAALCREAGFVPRRHPDTTHGSVAAADVLREGAVVTPTVPWREPPADLVFRPVEPPVSYPMSAMWPADGPTGPVQLFLDAAELVAGEQGWRAAAGPRPANATAAPSSGTAAPTATPPRSAAT